MKIRGIGPLLVLCALGFLCASSSLVPAHARTLVVYSDNHGEFRVGQQGKKGPQQKNKAGLGTTKSSVITGAGPGGGPHRR